MPKVTLTINDEEHYESNHPLITIGRTSDNNVALPDDTNISRYHARIEQREDGYWLIDQGSSNGSSVNGNQVETEMLLESGDSILLGGTSRISFETDEVKEEDDDDSASSAASSTAGAAESNDGEKAKGSSSMMLLAGVVVSVALISVAIAGVIYWKYSGSGCEASARIISPESGEALSESTEVEIDITNSQCVQKVVYLLNGKEVASSSKEPFTVTLDPKEHGDLADGGTYSLTVVLIDSKGEKIVQPSGGIYLAFETIETPTPKPEVTATPIVKTGGKTQQGKTISAIDTKLMGEQLLKQFASGNSYKFDQQFWVEVNKKLPEYVSEGYYSRAKKYEELINVSYVMEQNVDAPLGYILAMSRSKFNPQKQGAEEGLWRMTNDFVVINGLNGMCGTETISDVSQNCATKSTALYLKNVYIGSFERDIIYSVAAFGMSPQEAAQWKLTLPADRKDFWRHIKNPKQREEVVKFFAAGIVAENPQKFGLKTDLPLSNLYKITMGN
ncbi:MAG: FHA domain-containing protein [Acidobacteriota bacterium]